MAAYDAATHGDVDIIFAGGGTAACVAAGRLAKHNPDLKILLIEQGGNSFEDPTVRTPVLYPTNLLPTSKNTIFWKSEASKHLNGREAIVPSGGTLGGGSAINFLMYTRAQASDFDSWNTPGWSADDLIPLSNKLENYQHDAPGIDKSKHGHDGPITISDGGFCSTSADDFLATIKQMDREEIVDMQQFGSTGGWSKWQRYASKDGNRQDAAYTYLYPLVQGGKHPNLFILTNTQAIRVLFDNDGNGPPRAAGVECKTVSPDDAAAGSDSALTTIKATKLVVASSGALGTPLLLERSGVGSPEILKSVGIPVVSAVPGVGTDYQDHHLILYTYKTNLAPDQTVDGILSGRQDVGQLVKEKNPILGWNAIDICSKIQMTDDEVKSQDQVFQDKWKTEFANDSTKPLMLVGAVNGFLGDHSLVEPGQYTMLGCYTAYPWSRGSIHTNSATSISDYTFDNGFFNDESDVKSQIWAYKISREIARRLPYVESELAITHPQFAKGSKAANCDAHYAVSADHKEDVMYTAEDDAVIEDWVRSNVNTTWHSLGTCAMKPLEKGGTVDAALNVYGTRGLKIADLSIAPENVGANTNNTALVVGEKAATIIASELGIKI